MARKFDKFHPDPAVPISPERKKVLEQWGLWDAAKARGVTVEGEEAQDGAVGGSGTEGESPVTPDPSSASVGASTGSGDDDEAAPYSEWTVDELKAELKDRSLKVGGTHDELVARLEQDDEENPPET